MYRHAPRTGQKRRLQGLIAGELTEFISSIVRLTCCCRSLFTNTSTARNTIRFLKIAFTNYKLQTCMASVQRLHDMWSRYKDELFCSWPKTTNDDVFKWRWRHVQHVVSQCGWGISKNTQALQQLGSYIDFLKYLNWPPCGHLNRFDTQSSTGMNLHMLGKCAIPICVRSCQYLLIGWSFKMYCATAISVS